MDSAGQFTEPSLVAITAQANRTVTGEALSGSNNGNSPSESAKLIQPLIRQQQQIPVVLIVPPHTSDNSNNESAINSAQRPFTCQWEISLDNICNDQFGDPDAFYSHLAENHVGRKSTGNLSLNCKWIGCSHADRPFSKRDHIVSHCRAHVPFKANICIDCNTPFKWPQGAVFSKTSISTLILSVLLDLKKHCLKHGHKLVEPLPKAPGPSTVVTDLETGHQHLREGPRLTGGNRKPGRNPKEIRKSVNATITAYPLQIQLPNYPGRLISQSVEIQTSIPNNSSFNTFILPSNNPNFYDTSSRIETVPSQSQYVYSTESHHQPQKILAPQSYSLSHSQHNPQYVQEAQYLQTNSISSQAQPIAHHQPQPNFQYRQSQPPIQRKISNSSRAAISVLLNTPLPKTPAPKTPATTMPSVHLQQNNQAFLNPNTFALKPQIMPPQQPLQQLHPLQMLPLSHRIAETQQHTYRRSYLQQQDNSANSFSPKQPIQAINSGSSLRLHPYVRQQLPQPPQLLHYVQQQQQQQQTSIFAESVVAQQTPYFGDFAFGGLSGSIFNAASSPFVRLQQHRLIEQVDARFNDCDFGSGIGYGIGGGGYESAKPVTAQIQTLLQYATPALQLPFSPLFEAQLSQSGYQDNGVREDLETVEQYGFTDDALSVVPAATAAATLVDVDGVVMAIGVASGVGTGVNRAADQLSAAYGLITDYRVGEFGKINDDALF
ncbi:hypothetical protein HK100_007913 [Physocladia obscura]|uniref:C2H2-type domain-containing protein n=1 Tax=Physocladia obscura TaxID=109957 RepID=A0AAD5T675_9FUNG|nr:hypothetical protein HK100_007913 [Physocladia obscura]